MDEAARCASCLYVKFERLSVVESFPGEDGIGGGEDIALSLHAILSKSRLKLRLKAVDYYIRKVRQAQLRVDVSLATGRRAAAAPCKVVDVILSWYQGFVPQTTPKLPPQKHRNMGSK